MIIVDTPFHITFRTLSDEPSFACVSKCKKVFWLSDINAEIDRTICMQCGGEVQAATKGVHYKVLATSNRNIKLSDFEKFGGLTHKDKKQTQSWLASNAKFMHLSRVKKEFEARAIKEWIPFGLETKIGISGN
jgi:hypothetical protein